MQTTFTLSAERARAVVGAINACMDDHFTMVRDNELTDEELRGAMDAYEELASAKALIEAQLQPA